MATNYLTISRQALYNLVWSQPLIQIAKGFGISQEVLTKRCSDINVPVPPFNYWTRVEAGHAPQRPPLPKYRTASRSPADEPAQTVKQASAPSEKSRDAMLQHLRNAIEEPLKQEITQLRRTILELARDQELVYEALEKRMGESEPWVWQQQAVRVIIEHVKRSPLVKLSPPEIYSHMPGVTMIGHARVPCPLCGTGREPSTNQEDEANTIGTYSVPIGLEQHLEGYGSIRQCHVMAAARDLAREAWEQKTPRHEGRAR